MASNFAGNARAICPFYLRGTRLTITCEGFTGEACLIRFANADDRNNWAECCCEDYDYAMRCPYARMMMSLYE